MGSAPSVITKRASGARLQLGDRHHGGSVAGCGVGAWGPRRDTEETSRGRDHACRGQDSGTWRWDHGWEVAKDHRDLCQQVRAPPPPQGQGGPRGPRGTQLFAAGQNTSTSTSIRAPPRVSWDPR